MSTSEVVLKQIEGIRNIAHTNESPYPARMRVQRLVLTVTRSLADDLGLSKPDLPGPFQIPPGSGALAHNIALRCERIRSLAGPLCQPSEPLEERWHRSWKELLSEVDILKDLVSAYAGQAKRE